MRETLFQRNVSYIAIPRKLCYGCYKPIAILLLLTGTESSTWNLLKFLLVRSIDYQYLIIAIGPLHFIWNTACLWTVYTDIVDNRLRIICFLKNLASEKLKIFFSFSRQ